MNPATRTTTPRSWASSSHGETFASWSSAVTTISSPSLRVRAECARQQEVERGHARAEGGLVGRAAEERPGLLVREVDQLDGADARLVRRADVRVVLAQVARDRVDHLVGALRPAGPVEEGEAPVERREARANGSRCRASLRSPDFLAVDDPVVPGLRGERVAHEAAGLRPAEELRRALSGSGAGASCTSNVASISTNA